MRRRLLGLVVVLGVPMVACGDDAATVDGGSSAPATSAAELAPWCDDLSLGSVEEGRLAGGAPVDDTVQGAVQAYGTANSDEFGGMWIDREHGGTLVVVFTARSSPGGCQPQLALPEGVGPVDWAFDPAFPMPEPSDTEVHVLVTERSCTSGSPLGDRVLGPEIRETDEQVIVLFGAIPLRDGEQTCQGNRPEEVTIVLPSPLGDRILADGLSVPPRPAEMSTR